MDHNLYRKQFKPERCLKNWLHEKSLKSNINFDVSFSKFTKNEQAILFTCSYFDSYNIDEFIPLTQTHAWNFQQDCMAHWLGTSPDSLIIFNDFRNEQFVSVIINVHTRQEINKGRNFIGKNKRNKSSVNISNKISVPVVIIAIKIQRLLQWRKKQNQNYRPKQTENVLLRRSIRFPRSTVFRQPLLHHRKRFYAP